MSETTTTSTAEPAGLAEALHAARPRNQLWRGFVALLWRDTFVTGRELGSFLAQVIIQPLFMLFIFGKVLGELGFTQGNFIDVLLPGVIGFTAFLTALQNTALPLVIEFSWTKEIEDRLLAPVPTDLVAIEKMIFATVRGLIAGLVMFPLGWLILGSLPMSWSALPLVLVYLVLGSLVGAAVGMTLGTAVPATKINIMFAVILTPLMFTGATQFPWPALDSLRWFQIICAFNPLTYVSEALRGEMVPEVPHMPEWVSMLGMLGFLAIFTFFGVKGFRKRAID